MCHWRDDGSGGREWKDGDDGDRDVVGGGVRAGMAVIVDPYMRWSWK